MRRVSLSLPLGVVGALCCGAVYASQGDRPNVIYIMSDDHGVQGIGAYGSRFASLNPSPNIDKLAAEGVLFTNVFCTNSISTPSRATILTGQYSHVNGAYDLYSRLGSEDHHLLREVSEAGYATAVVGKWHLTDAPGFVDYFAVLPGQGRYMNPLIQVSEGGRSELVSFDSTMSLKVNVIETKGHSSDVLTDLSIEWLDKKRDKSKPFFLCHHFKAPHDFFEYAPRYAHYMEDEFMPEPDNLYDQPGEHFGSVATRGVDDSLVGSIGSTISPQPAKKKRSLADIYVNKRKVPREVDGRALSDREKTHLTYQLYVKEYMRCIKGVDDNLGRLVEYLKANGLYDNTIIVYTSDQGMILGEHNFIDKRWMYEESIRMPLIVRDPRAKSAAGQRCAWLINNSDYAPTLLDLIGVDTPDYMQGASFKGGVEGGKQPKDWRTGTYYRYWMHMAHKHNNPAHFGIRTERYKLIFFYGTDYTDLFAGRKVQDKGGNRFWGDTPVAWELYDLQKDPNEMVNQYSNPKYADVVKRLKVQLSELRKEVGEDDSRHPEIKKIIDENYNF